jgi:hypothetical protein
LKYITMMIRSFVCCGPAKESPEWTQERRISEYLLESLRTLTLPRTSPAHFGTAKHISISKNAASGVAGGLRSLTVETILRRLGSVLMPHKTLLFAAGLTAATPIFHSYRGRNGDSSARIPREESLQQVPRQRGLFTLSRVSNITWFWQYSASLAAGNSLRILSGKLPSARAIPRLVFRLQAKCKLEPNLWYADFGTLVGSVANLSKVYQIIKDDGRRNSSSSYLTRPA